MTIRESFRFWWWRLTANPGDLPPGWRRQLGFKPRQPPVPDVVVWRREDAGVPPSRAGERG